MELSMYINGARHAKVFLENGQYLAVYYQNEVEQNRSTFGDEDSANNAAEDWVMSWRPE